MTEDNLLERLRQNRQRSNVPKRDDALIASSEKDREDEEDQQKPTELQTESKQVDFQDNTLVNLKAELAKCPETNRHSAIVLEKKLDLELTRYCKEQKITVETFLEAAWTIVANNPELLNQITDEAQIRYQSRKEAGKLRRLITMLSKHS